MTRFQPGIAAPVPKHARFVTLQYRQGRDPRRELADLASEVDGSSTVLGLGADLVAALGASVTGLRSFPTLQGTPIAMPSTPAALWCWIRGDDRGDLVHSTRRIASRLDGAFRLDQVIDAFMHHDSRDLTGYEDGTENPTGEALETAAFASDGSSYVAVQQWLHDLGAFDALSPTARDDIVGRHRVDNEEFEEAPDSAHVKRTAQESFDPPAFVLRRSMPWADSRSAGLVFVAFGRSFDAFEAQLSRMAGVEDGILDGLFSFTRPITGSYFWCPPMNAKGLDLSALL